MILSISSDSWAWLPLDYLANVLGCLYAALSRRYAVRYLTAVPLVRLPARFAPRDRRLTRDDVPVLLRAERSDSRTWHLTRFVLVSDCTGTRSESILGLDSMPQTAGGWVDTDCGIMDRRGVGVAETGKRQPPVSLPRQLLAHPRRREGNSARFVFEYHGDRVASAMNAWATALKARPAALRVYVGDVARRGVARQARALLPAQS